MFVTKFWRSYRLRYMLGSGQFNDNYYTFNSLSLFWSAESVQWIFEISPRLGRHPSADYTIIMSRILKISVSHVMYDRGAWFLRVIMSSLRAFCCSPICIFLHVWKQIISITYCRDHFFFRSRYDKTITRFGVRIE